jgi:hypothetical protein
MSSRVPILRTSERRSFKRCPQQWAWAWRQGLRPNGFKADALWFGSGIHLALAERYKYKGLRRGKNVLKVWRDYVNDEIAYVRTLPIGSAGVDEEPVWVSALELGEAMLGEYLDRYGMDERWYWIATEQSLEVPIARPSRPGSGPATGGTLVTYGMTFDGAARDEASQHGDLWLFEHKTAKAIMLGHLPLDDQAGSYWAFAHDALLAQGLITKDQHLEGIMYNFLRKAKPDARPRNEDGEYLNKDGSVSKSQPSPLLVREPVYRSPVERRTQVARIQAEALAMEAYRTKQLPLFKTPTTDCAYMCPFYAMCELHENGDDWREYRSAMFKVEDPYQNHRKSTEE